jgi:hypothetical protein
MIDLTNSLETIKDALHEKVISINSAIYRTIDNVKIRNMLKRRNKFQNLLDEIKDGISKNNTIVMLTTDEMKKYVQTQVLDNASNSNEKKKQKYNFLRVHNIKR